MVNTKTPRRPGRKAQARSTTPAAAAPPPSPAGSQPPWTRARFVLAAHELRQLPDDAGREVAFAGRSNAGKSSALNAITGVSGLARISKTPGRTQQLVVFELDATRRLIDLPGYGYAEVPVRLREHWGQTLTQYFETRASLAGLVIAMDVRHPLTAYDEQMLGFAALRGMPVHVLLTKADKLGRGAGGIVRRKVAAALEERGALASVQLFSAPERMGVDEARGVVAGWLAETP
jgi:GTP-binding protein